MDHWVPTPLISPEDQGLAAMEIFELYLTHDLTHDLPASPDWYDCLSHYHSCHGVLSLRQLIYNTLAPRAWADFKAATARGYEDSFDYEFLPLWLEQVVTPAQGPRIILKPFPRNQLADR